MYIYIYKCKHRLSLARKTIRPSFHLYIHIERERGREREREGEREGE
jgi:hypothetical protein